MAKRSPQLNDPGIHLERVPGVPLRRQLYLALRHWIAVGEMRAGERLPSTRALATTLGVSRNTVLSAYERLAADQCVRARVGSGTRVGDPNAAGTAARAGRVGIHSRDIGLQARLRGILQRSGYPLRSRFFADTDGNALYVFDSRA